MEDEVIFIPVKAVIEIVAWGIIIMSIITIMTSFLFFAVARNEIETAKRRILAEVDEYGGFSHSNVINAINNAKSDFGIRNTGLFDIGEIKVDYEDNSDYFGAPMNLSVSRDIVLFKFLGSGMSLNIKTSNGITKRSNLNPSLNDRYQLGDEFFDSSENSSRSF